MSQYSPEQRQIIIDAALSAICEGASVREACREVGVSTSTFMRWLDEDKALQERYARAHKMGSDALADRLIEISNEPVGTTDNGGTDTGAVQKQRLQCDTLKWILAKRHPTKYGDRIEVEATVTELTPSERQARLSYLLGKVKPDGSGGTD